MTCLSFAVDDPRLYAAFHERLPTLKQDEKKEVARTWEFSASEEVTPGNNCPGAVLDQKTEQQKPPVL